MTNSENVNNSSTYLFDEFSLSVSKRELSGPGGLVSVEKKVMDLLVYLIKHRDRAISKDELQQAVWPDTIVTEAALTRAIMKARRAVNDSADVQSIIRTLHSEGYRFVAEVVTSGTPPILQSEPAAPGPTAPARYGALITAGVALMIVIISGYFLWSAGEKGQPLPDSADATVAASTIAVLPFENLSPDPAHAYFADGIHDEILNQISRSTELQVLARASVKHYAGSELAVSDIAARLSADNLLTGSIRYANDRVRISTQLIDGASGITLWSSNYDRDFKDIFDIQSDVATKIAIALNSKMTDAGEIVVTPTSSEAYREYLLARSYRDRTFETGWNPVLEHVNRALHYDPAFIPALWLLHNAYQNRIIGDTHEAAYRNMLDITQRAVAADPDHALTLTLLAKDAAYGWDWQASVDAWEKALLADSSNPVVFGDAAFVNLVYGDLERAEEIINGAIRTNPRHDWPHYADLHLQRMLEDEQAFLDSANLIMSVGGNRAFPTSFTLALHHMEAGDAAAVRRYGETLTRMTGGRLQGVADLLVAITEGEDVEPAALANYVASNPPTNNYKWMTTQIYLSIDAMDHALATLEDIADSRALFSVIKIHTDPAFARLRATPEYEDFRLKVRLSHRDTDR
jgi:TolB-like protein